MALPKHCESTTSRPGHPKADEAEENDFQNNFMKRSLKRKLKLALKKLRKRQQKMKLVFFLANSAFGQGTAHISTTDEVYGIQKWISKAFQSFQDRVRWF